MRITLWLALQLGLIAAAHAQSTSGLVRLPENSKSSDTYGNICLSKLVSSSRPMIGSNTKLLEQSVEVHNRCLKPIFVEVCFTGQRRCKQSQVPAMDKVIIVLGFDQSNYFRFDYQELKPPF